MIPKKSGIYKLSCKTKFGNVILDTRASQHLTDNFSLLRDVVYIPLCSIDFADVTQMFALNTGVLLISEKISLLKNT